MGVYLLDWSETAYGKQPKPLEVKVWLEARGITCEGMPKVYANGTVQVECSPGVEAIWPNFQPTPLTVEDRLAGRIQELLTARAEVLRIPVNSRSALERLTLANTELLLYGYGIADE